MTKSKIKNMSLSVAALALLSACAPQYTPTMMNTSRVELSHETMVEQIPMAKISDTDLLVIAEQYRKNGNGPLDLTITYDPKSKDFTAMSALHDLKHIREVLKTKNITNISTQTLAAPEGKPSLIVSYELVRAQAPSDCTPMPGLDNNETGRFIGDYKFGCATESLIAKQIARPSDLEGNATLGARSARRDAIVIEGYSAGVPREPLEGLERGDLVAD
jgi:type IV pilus biogenesis protein CpaD/CtpE